VGFQAYNEKEITVKKYGMYMLPYLYYGLLVKAFQGFLNEEEVK
jgi:hypothetical protein